jgi:hypothetical protein
MSAFQVPAEHLNYLVNACQLWNVFPARRHTPEQLGALLSETNAEAMTARYPKHGPFAPVPHEFTIVPKRKLTPVQVLKAAKCYEYQAMELTEWRTSSAKEIIDYLIDAATSRLPGYEAAAWTIEAA